MLYSYSGFPERSFFIFAKSKGDSETIKEHTTGNDTHADQAPMSEIVSYDKGENAQIDLQGRNDDEKNGLPQEPMVPAQSMVLSPLGHASDSEMERDIRVKMNVMSGLSIILTLMSVLVAFRYDYLIVWYVDHVDRLDHSISIITIMGLIGQECASCVRAAEADDGHGGGLAGRWWRGWAAVSFFYYTFSSCQIHIFINLSA